MQRYVAAAGVLLALFFLAVGARRAPAQSNPPHASTQNPVAPNVNQSAARDGSHDFDWDIGSWKTHQKRLLHPLTGSTTWVEYQGTDVVRRIWDGANEGLVEAQGPAGRLEIYTLRVYNPDAHQWNIYFTNPATGALGPPAVANLRMAEASSTTRKRIAAAPFWYALSSSTSPRIRAVLSRHSRLMAGRSGNRTSSLPRL